jgi:hypothetical protein
VDGESTHLIRSVVMLSKIALLLLVGGAHVLWLVRGGWWDVGDGGALAAEVSGEEEDGDGAPKDGRYEGQGEGRHKWRRRHLLFTGAAEVVADRVAAAAASLYSFVFLSTPVVGLWVLLCLLFLGEVSSLTILKKITPIFSILLYQYITFQAQIYYSLVIKRKVSDKFCQIFLMLFCS